MSGKPVRPILLLLTLWGLLTVPASALGQGLEVTPASPRQGEALFVRLPGEDLRDAQATWQGETLPLYPQGDGWAAVLPITPDTRAGGHTLTVSFRRNGRREVRTKKVTVAKVAFAVQYLKMAAGRARLYNYPGAKAEDAAVSRALRTRSEERLWEGDWSLPTQGRFSTPFGVRRLRNGRPVGRHRGVDIAAPTGTLIVAPAAGRVVLARKAAEFKKYGGTVVLDHGGGVTSLYIHMSAIGVSEGQVLAKGDKIGRVGAEGVATGPHLHWAVYAFGDSISPLFFTKLRLRGVEP